MKHRMLKTVDDGNWRQFVNAPAAVLTLSISTCPACAEWQEQLDGWIARDRRRIGIRFGKVVLDSTATAEFKRDNEWLDEVPGLPFSAVFVNGELEASFAGGGVSRLERRLEGLRHSLDLSSTGEAAAPPTIDRGASVPETSRNAKT